MGGHALASYLSGRRLGKVWTQIDRGNFLRRYSLGVCECTVRVRIAWKWLLGSPHTSVGLLGRQHFGGRRVGGWRAHSGRHERTVRSIVRWKGKVGWLAGVRECESEASKRVCVRSGPAMTGNRACPADS